MMSMLNVRRFHVSNRIESNRSRAANNYATTGTRSRFPHAPHLHTPSGAFNGACTVIAHVGHTHATTLSVAGSSNAADVSKPGGPLCARFDFESSSSLITPVGDDRRCGSLVDGMRNTCKHRAHMHSACDPAGLMSTAVLRETRAKCQSPIHTIIAAPFALVVAARTRLDT